MTQDPASPEDRIRRSGNRDEQRVNLLFLHLGFNLIEANDIYRRNGTRIGEIDGIFSIENNVLLIETKNKRSLPSNEIISFYEKWVIPENESLVKERHNLNRCSFLRIFVDLRHKNPGQDPSIQPFLLSENHILYKDDIEIIEENYSIIGPRERNNLLRRLRIQKERTSVEKDAIFCRISGKRAFVFSLPANELLDCATVARRHAHDTGYQRSIRKSRITTMQRRIEDGSILAFPNSILVNSEIELLPSALIPSPYLRPVHVKINLPTDYSFLKIIDGQHRLLAFSKIDPSIQRQHDLAIIAFDCLNLEEETDLFIEINSTQIRVDPSLRILLKSAYADNPTHRFWYDKIGVDIAKELDRASLLKNRIYMGYAGTSASSKLVTLTTLVAALKRNKFIGARTFFQRSPEDSQTVVTKIRSILNRLRRNGMISSQEKFFLKDKGIRILFRYVEVCKRNIQAGNIAASLNEALDTMCSVTDSNLLNQFKIYAGLGGVKQAVDEIISELSTKPEFSNIESDLRRLP